MMKKGSSGAETLTDGADVPHVTSTPRCAEDTTTFESSSKLSDQPHQNLCRAIADNSSTSRCRLNLASLSSGEHLVGAKTLTKQSSMRTHVKRYSDSLFATCMKQACKGTNIGDVPAKSGTAGIWLDSPVPLKCARSFHNVCTLSSGSADFADGAGGLRRASSFQNLDLNVDAPRSSPVSISMACNAELLASFERERRHFEDRISELLQLAESRRTEAERLKIEVRELRASSAISSANTDVLNLLRHENQMMRDRLAEFNVTVEHFTDAEKLTLLQGRNSTDHDSTSVISRETDKLRTFSDIGDVVQDNEGELALSGGSLDANWDRGSEGAFTVGSGSEVSMACLQDRLLAMEETQYSTNEELAATLQELGDLQNAINCLTIENEKLADERAILLESLCTQTQKLENSRRQIQHLQMLLFRDSNTEERSENERQLMALVHSAEEEREELLLKQGELCNTIEVLESEKEDLCVESISLREQLADVSREKHLLEMQVTSLTETALQRADELQRCQLQEEGTSQAGALVTVEQDHCAHCQKLEGLLANSRLELGSATSESIQLRSQLTNVEDQFKEFQHSALCRSTEMEHRLHEAERDSEEARSAINMLRVSSAHAAEEQRAAIARLESELRIARMQVADSERAVSEISVQFDAARKEWESFQRDLQTAVVVAVDIRTEAQEDLERLQAENQSLRDREATVRRELEATKAEVVQLRSMRQIQDNESQPVTTGTSVRDHFVSSVDRDFPFFHQAGRRASDLCIPASSGSQPSLSVQRLISSVEERIKSAEIPLAESSGCELRPGRAKDNGRPLPDSVTSGVTLTKPVLMRYWSHSAANKACATSDNEKRNTVDGSNVQSTDEAKCAAAEASVLPPVASGSAMTSSQKPLAGILSNKSGRQKSLHGDVAEKTDKPSSYLMTVAGHVAKPVDPLASLAKQLGGSKRNALLKWCQNRTATYTGIDITNFSSSWNDGLAFCALMHSYLPEHIPYNDLNSYDKMRNFSLAFEAAESVGIACNLNMNEMISTERPDWQAVMAYVTIIYRHFEADCRSQ